MRPSAGSPLHPFLRCMLMIFQLVRENTASASSSVTENNKNELKQILTGRKPGFQYCWKPETRCYMAVAHRRQWVQKGILLQVQLQDKGVGFTLRHTSELVNFLQKHISISINSGSYLLRKPPRSKPDSWQLHKQALCYSSQNYTRMFPNIKTINRDPQLIQVKPDKRNTHLLLFMCICV